MARWLILLLLFAAALPAAANQIWYLPDQCEEDWPGPHPGDLDCEFYSKPSTQLAPACFPGAGPSHYLLVSAAQHQSYFGGVEWRCFYRRCSIATGCEECENEGLIRIAENITSDCALWTFCLNELEELLGPNETAQGASLPDPCAL